MNIQLLITAFGSLFMLLTSVSGCSFIDDYINDYQNLKTICDNFIISDYWYTSDYKAMAYGISNESSRMTCYRSSGHETQQKAISTVLEYCKSHATGCEIMAIGNNMYGPTKWRSGSTQSNQTYSGENKVCNSTVAGGCIVK